VEASAFKASPFNAECNQTGVLFVGLPAPFRHTRLGTVQGTVDESPTPSVQKTERKRGKATVSLTAAQDVVLAADDEDALAGVTAGVRMF
jgi:hypothetical protein